jgi:hypothetical protein
VILAVLSAKSGAQQFTDVTVQYGLDSTKVKLGKGCYSWADYNNDGKLELLYTGDSLSVKISRIYALNKSGTQYRDTTCYAVPGGLVKFATSAVAWADYNNDGYLDFAICGFTGTMGGSGSTYSSSTLIYKNNGDGTFTQQQTISLQSVDLGSLSWGDYNHDGKLDLLVMGRYGNAKSAVPYAAQSASYRITKLYIGDGATFTDAGLTFASAEGGAASLVDLDNDGWLDLYLSGYPTAHSFYLNKKDGTFSTLSNRGLGTTASRGTVGAFGDYNYDGNTDFLTSYITSAVAPPSAVASKFFLYQGGSSTFTSDANFAPGIGIAGYYNWGNGELAMADYDNDGYLDFFAGGYQIVGSTISYFAKLYHNKGASNNYIFTDTTSQTGVFSAIPAGVWGGSAQWIDFNNDGKLDLFFGGSITTSYYTRGRTYLFQNTGAKANTAPSAPANLTATVNGSDATFTWGAAADAETPQKGVTYELRVGSTHGGTDIISPFSDPSTGYNRVSAAGKLTENDRSIGYLLKGIPSGTYYWSVHAIDGGLMGGTWASEGTFTISSIQASNIVVSNIDTTSITTISWTNGSEANRAVFMKQAATIMPFIIDTAITANAAFGTAGSNYRSTGWYCVYNGSGSTVDVTGLRANKGYTIAVLEYSGSGSTTKYNLCKATGNPYTITTYITPTTQATNVTFSSITGSSFVASWTNGDGGNRAVFVYQGNSGTAAPVNCSGYVASAKYGSGSQIGTSGWYCVYKGTGTSVTVTGLSEKAPYNVMVCEYNGIAGAENYLVTTSTGNPASTNTISAITLQASGIAVEAGSEEFDITWTNGNGQKRAVFMAVDIPSTPANALDNQTYVADTTFTLGTSDGAGWYCVYNGTGNAVSVTGLTLNTMYTVAIYEYNGTAGNEKYLTSTATDNPVSLKTSSKIPQHIIFGALASRTYGDPPFYVSATGGASGNPVTFTSSNTSVATVTDSLVTIVGAGSTNITANQLGDTTYADAAKKVRALIINKAPQTISFGALPTKTWGDSAFVISATGGEGQSDNPITFTSYYTKVATVSGSVVTIIGAGTDTIKAILLGNSNYRDTFALQRLIINKAHQTILFPALPTKTYPDVPFAIGASVNTGLPLTYTSLSPEVATVSNDTITIVCGGLTKITVSQAGTSNYLAESSSQTLTVNKASQTITFDALPEMKTGDPDYPLTATSSTGLKVSYTCSDVSIAVIQGNPIGDSIHIYGVGTANITAIQEGNDCYAASNSIVQPLTVTRGTTDISELAESDIIIYPNPVADKLTVSFSNLLPNVCF